MRILPSVLVWSMLLSSALYGQQHAAPETVYAVVFGFVIDQNGDLKSFRVSKVIDPRSGSVDPVAVEVPKKTQMCQILEPVTPAKCGNDWTGRFGRWNHINFFSLGLGTQNANTTYRALTSLGREVFETDSHQELLFGSTKIVERWRASVVRIVNADGDGIGTEFVVGPTTIATAWHVVDSMPKFIVESEDGNKFEHTEVVRHPHETIDLALVRLRSAVNIRNFRVAISFDLLDPVVVFGYPPIPRTKDAYLVVNRGEICATPILYHDDQRILVVSCLLRDGNSGGPIVDSRGAVVGIVSQQLFKLVAPEEKSINESLGMAAATEAQHLKVLTDGNVA